MLSNVSPRVWLVMSALLGVCVLLSTVHAEGDDIDPRVFPVGAKVEGKSYGEWSAAWWQWALSIKKDRNPILDKTGAFAGEGQKGPVWFLAGNSGGKSRRKCSVPAGKPVFVAVLNYVENAVPDKAEDKKLVAAAKAEMDRTTDVELTLDEKPIIGLARFRVASPVFTFVGPDKADAPFEDTVGKQKAASDGYWVMLKPLAVGKHTLQTKGKLKASDGKMQFELDVTFELTVVDKK